MNVRVLLLVLGTFGATLACTGGPATTGDGTRPGNGQEGAGFADESTAGNAGSLDTSGATKITMGIGVCGGVRYECYGQRSDAIDLIAQTLVSSACVGDGGSATAPSKTLTAAQVQSIRDALAQIRATSEVSHAYDGRMEYLEVTSASGTIRYSPQATCNQSAFKTVVAGWEALGSAIEAAKK